MHHLSIAFQKLMAMLQCLCIIWLNTVKIIKKTTGSLWNYYRGEPSNPLSSNSEYFEYKKSITGSTYKVDDGEAGYDENKWN